MTQQEPDDVQVPEWIGRLVRLAERARGVLIAELPVMAVTAVLAGALTRAAGSMTPWPPVLCALEGFALVERRGGAGAGALLAVADIVGSGLGAVVLVVGLLAGGAPAGGGRGPVRDRPHDGHRGRRPPRRTARDGAPARTAHGCGTRGPGPRRGRGRPEPVLVGGPGPGRGRRHRSSCGNR